MRWEECVRWQLAITERWRRHRMQMVSSKGRVKEHRHAYVSGGKTKFLRPIFLGSISRGTGYERLDPRPKIPSRLLFPRSFSVFELLSSCWTFLEISLLSSPCIHVLHFTQPIQSIEVQTNALQLRGRSTAQPISCPSFSKSILRTVSSS